MKPDMNKAKDACREIIDPKIDVLNACIKSAVADRRWDSAKSYIEAMQFWESKLEYIRRCSDVDALKDELNNIPELWTAIFEQYKGVK